MEIALHTGDRLVQTESPDADDRAAGVMRLDRKPRGSILVAITDQWIKAKWVEKFGYMMHPAKREMWPTMPYRDAIIADWKHGWYQAWHDMARLGLLTSAEAWSVIFRLGVPDLGKDPSGTLDITDCWMWTPTEKKLFLIGRTDHDGETVNLQQASVHQHGESKAIGPRYRIDYRTDLGLSAEDVQRAEDPATEVEPRRDLLWPKAAIRENFAASDVILPRIGGPDGR